MPALSQSPSISKIQKDLCLNKSSAAFQSPETINSKDMYTTVQLEVQFPGLDECVTKSSKELSAIDE